MDKDIIIYLSTDGGYSYRYTCVNEHGFKQKLWLLACKWLRPDSPMSIHKFGPTIIIRHRDTMSHIATIEITGGNDLMDIWGRICQAWDSVLWNNR